jgi:hypothetical protein
MIDKDSIVEQAITTACFFSFNSVFISFFVSYLPSIGRISIIGSKSQSFEIVAFLAESRVFFISKDHLSFTNFTVSIT